MIIHAVSGSVIFLETLIAGVVGTAKHGFSTTWHSLVGYLVLFICFIISVYGFFAWYYQVYAVKKTYTIKAIKMVHRVLGYLLIMLSRVAMTSGVFMYNDRDPNSMRSFLGILDLFFFFGMWGVMEIVFQYYMKKSYKLNEDDLPIITIPKFSKRVKAGERLVILDDLVLDVTKYMYAHPGGRYLLEANIGRDVSKFFYGGY